MWFRVCPVAAPPSGGRGKASDSAAMTCLWADLDYQDGGPSDEKTALDVLGKIIPIEPSIIVRSGLSGPDSRQSRPPLRIFELQATHP